jgi:hypothetical protein
VVIQVIDPSATSLARAFRLPRHTLADDRIVCFCDPLACFDAAGREVKRQHIGVIY